MNAVTEPTLNDIFDTLSEEQKCALYELIGSIMENRVICTSIFCEREIGKDYVNHIDGNKLNNSADNLEWCTKSENTLHSFRNGLQNNVGGIPVYSEEEKEYIRDHRYDDRKEVADHIGRNPETVRKYMYKYRRECDND